MRLIVGITGATGVVHAVRLLEALASHKEIETHVIMSDWAIETLKEEMGVTAAHVEKLASRMYRNSDLSASISSGSFLTDGMIILPCSMKTLAAISCGFCDNLIARSADVCMKEGRRLVLCPRETPLDAIHLENMLKLSRFGVRIVPPMPAYYTHPATIDDLINHHVMKVLDQFGIQTRNAVRWNGSSETQTEEKNTHHEY